MVEELQQLESEPEQVAADNLYLFVRQELPWGTEPESEDIVQELVGTVQVPGNIQELLLPGYQPAEGRGNKLEPADNCILAHLPAHTAVDTEADMEPCHLQTDYVCLF